MLETFGVHMYASGLSMKEENIPLFTERFEQFVSETILEEQTYPQIEIDALLERQQAMQRELHRIGKAAQ